MDSGGACRKGASLTRIEHRVIDDDIVESDDRILGVRSNALGIQRLRGGHPL
jgi:hypothetical protein